MKKKLILTVFILGAILASIAQITVTSFFSTDGIQYSSLQEQAMTLNQENELLAEKVYDFSSLTHIASVSATLGFVPSNTAVTITNPLPIAFKP